MEVRRSGPRASRGHQAALSAAAIRSTTTTTIETES